MDINQERKYDAVDGKIVNRATGKPIPDDEPIIIFRAKDPHAVMAMAEYIDYCQNDQHKQVITGRMKDFLDFARNHPERMKEPDSDESCLRPDKVHYQRREIGEGDWEDCTKSQFECCENHPLYDTRKL